MSDTVATVIYAVFLGILQGITEFLPVSSSAHLIVVSYFTDGRPLPLALNVALHVGTFGAVLAYFWRDWLRIAGAVGNRAFKGQRSHASDTLVPGLIIGTIPAGVLGLLFEDDIERIFHNPVTVIAPLALVGILLWWVDRRWPGPKGGDDVTIMDALLIGCGQACALIPGFSRSGSTIIAARLRGLGREEAARFSFMLGTPAMAGAAVLKGREILNHIGDPVFYVGVLTSFLTGCLCIGFLLRFLRKFGFGAFALYRLGLAAMLLFVAVKGS